mgnify:CR=1 FL=1
MNEADKLIHDYLEGRLDHAGRRRLSELVVTDAIVRARVQAAAETHGLLLTLADYKAARTGSPQKVTAFPRPAENERPATDRNLRPILVAAGIAAAVAIVAFLGLQFRHPGKPAGAVARLASDKIIDWAAGAKPDREGWILPGTYRLQAGTVRLQTEAGAIVSIAAPAEFEFLSADVLRLRSGKLLARMLREESKLSVLANGLNVQDLGTAFGINTSTHGASLLSVLDGKVELLNQVPDHPNQIVTAGHSMLLGPNNHSGSPVSVAFDRITFEDLWPLTLGVDAMSNLIRFLPPGPYDNPMAEFRNDTKIFLMPERQGVHLSSPLLIEARRSGREVLTPNYAPSTLPAGQRVDSYLLFFNPASASIAHPLSISGQITFNRPIIGLIFRRDEHLYRSDEQVGVPGLNYRAETGWRGLEVAPDELPAQDIVEVSADGRQLFFNLSVSDQRDQLRVILRADGVEFD